MNRIAIFSALAASVAVAGCSYNAESSFLGYRSSISYSTPGAYVPPPAPPPGPAPGYSPTPTSPPPGPSTCWRNGRYVC